MPVVVPAALTMPQDQENGGANTLHSFSRDKGRRDKDDTPPAPVLAPEPVMARVQTPVVPETSTPAAESEATEEAAAAAEVKAAAEKAAEEAAARRVALEELHAAYTAWSRQPITVDAAEMAPHSSRLRGAIAAAIACGVAVESLSLSMDENEEMRAEYKADMEAWAEDAAAAARAVAPAPAPVPGPEAAGDEVEVMGELTWYERDQKKREEAIELSSDSESE